MVNLFLFLVLLRDSYFVFLAFWTLSAGLFTVAKCANLAMNISNFKTVTRHPIVYQSSNNNILHMHTRGNHIQMKTKMNRNPKSEKWNLVWNKNIIDLNANKATLTCILCRFTRPVGTARQMLIIARIGQVPIRPVQHSGMHDYEMFLVII
jgi:hypothetical protein